MLVKITTIILLTITISVFSQNNILLKKYTQAQEYLENSMPDLAINELMAILKTENLRQNFFDSIKIALAEGYRQKRDFEKGIDILMPLIQKQDFIKAKAYNRIAALYDEWLASGKTRFDSTVKYSKLCLEISLKNNYNLLTASSKNELAFVYMKRKSYVKAKKLFEQSLSIYNKEKMYSYAANVAINLSNTNLYLNKKQTALDIINNAIKNINPEKHRNMFMRLILQKAKIFEKQLKYDSACVYLSKARLLQKQFFHDRMDKQVFEMSAKYDLKLKESKLREIEQKNQRKQTENKFLIIFILLLLLLFVIVIYVVYLKRISLIKEKELAKKEQIILQNRMKQKNQELTNAIAHSVASNKLLNAIKKLLQENKHRDVINLINANINTDCNWNDFLVRFNENHPHFFYLLEKKHPNLTKNEIKLSAFLLMKLTSKEIAHILNIEISSVNKARQRLRKKLSIPSNADFYSYLNSL